MLSITAKTRHYLLLPTSFDSTDNKWSKTSDAPSSKPNNFPKVDSKIALPSWDMLISSWLLNASETNKKDALFGVYCIENADRSQPT